MSKADEKSETYGAAGITASITSIVNALFSLAKLALVGGILVLAWNNRALVGPYVARWLDSTTHVSFLGLSLDRQISAEKTITEIAERNDHNLPKINARLTRAVPSYARQEMLQRLLVRVFDEARLGGTNGRFKRLQ
jgi:hypothetical protein